MNDIYISKTEVNPATLDTALRVALPDLIAGISAAQGEVIVHFTRQPTDSEITLAHQIVENHDPTELTAEQQAKVERLNLLNQLRNDVGAPVDLSDFMAETASLQLLAQKVALLELELQELRGG